MIQQQKVKTAINTLTQKQATSSLKITAHEKKKVTSRDLRVTRVLKVFKDVTDVKVYQDQRDATDVMEPKDLQAVMDATEKTY